MDLANACDLHSICKYNNNDKSMCCPFICLAYTNYYSPFPTCPHFTGDTPWGIYCIWSPARDIISHTHANFQILLQPKWGMHTWQSQDACALCRHSEPCKRRSWNRAELAGEQAFPHSKWRGYLKSHLDYCCFVGKGLEFAFQQMPGTQSQLGGLVRLVRGRWKIWW